MANAARMHGRIPLVVWLTLLLVAVSAPHAAEDFQFGGFARLGILPWIPATALGLVYAAQTIGAYLVGRDSRPGFWLLAAAGAVWCIGAIWVHGAEIVTAGDYRHGFISKALEVAVIVLGGSVAVAGVVGQKKRG